MEKDDKIQLGQRKSQKIGGLIAILALIVVVGFYTNDNFKAEVQKDYYQVANQFAHPHQRRTNQAEIESLQQQYNTLDEQVRELKARVKIMETDPECQRVTGELQAVARKLIVAKYGPPPYRVKVDLEFPPTIPDFATGGKDGSITIEMAPIELIPVSVWTFLEVSRTFLSGSFHRNAGHVLQVQVKSSEIKKHLPFQEYSKDFPHKKGTTGYCGRPSGPCWYVSIQDNTVNHGPGSQQKANPYEADANFGTVVEGFDTVVQRIHTIPQTGWLDATNQIKIIQKTILVSDGNGGFIPWVDPNGGNGVTALQ